MPGKVNFPGYVFKEKIKKDIKYIKKAPIYIISKSKVILLGELPGSVRPRKFRLENNIIFGIKDVAGNSRRNRYEYGSTT